MRTIIQLSCVECKRRNYTTTINKRIARGKLERNKYCPFCRKHTKHRQVK